MQIGLLLRDALGWSRAPRFTNCFTKRPSMVRATPWAARARGKCEPNGLTRERTTRVAARRHKQRCRLPASLERFETSGTPTPLTATQLEARRGARPTSRVSRSRARAASASPAPAPMVARAPRVPRRASGPVRLGGFGSEAARASPRRRAGDSARLRGRGGHRRRGDLHVGSCVSRRRVSALRAPGRVVERAR